MRRGAPAPEAGHRPGPAGTGPPDCPRPPPECGIGSTARAAEEENAAAHGRLPDPLPDVARPDVGTVLVSAPTVAAREVPPGLLRAGARPQDPHTRRHRDLPRRRRRRADDSLVSRTPAKGSNGPATPLDTPAHH
ncbi:hypothetical protein GCM10022205_34380 [Spinactinospora alkalitolerans]